MPGRNVSEMMRTSLSQDRWKLLRLLAEEATNRGVALYVVGGAVRDAMLGRQVTDLDFTMEGDAIALARALASRHGGRVTPHDKFGTANWFLPAGLRADQDVLDLVSARSETYRQPAALPTVKMGSLADDLRRRDFTINAMAIRLDGEHFGELRDDFSGLDDLQKGIVRVLHARSFIDDPTRIYRAVRYERRYAFKIDEHTLALIPAGREYVRELSGQRIRRELDLILDEPNAVRMLARLDELDVLACIHPALANFHQTNLAASRTEDPVLQTRNARWVLWLMHLTEQEIEFLNDRLHFKADLLKVLHSASLLQANLNALAGLKPSQAVEILETYSFKALEVVSRVVRNEEIRNTLTRYLTDWWHVKPKTTGHELKKRGLAPGPLYAEILRRLRAAWLDGEVKTEEEEKAFLDNLLKH